MQTITVETTVSRYPPDEELGIADHMDVGKHVLMGGIIRVTD